MKLTPRQREVLDAITSFIAEKGYSPTDAELGERIGSKPTTARHFIDVLERKRAVYQPRGKDGRALPRTVRPAG